jgi:DNA-directed RNA polymerase specialized sigma24 family protein
VFVLYFIEGRTLGEIAEINGHSIATAKRRLARANERFQYFLGKNPELLELLRSKRRKA